MYKEAYDENGEQYYYDTDDLGDSYQVGNSDNYSTDNSYNTGSIFDDIYAIPDNLTPSLVSIAPGDTQETTNAYEAELNRIYQETELATKKEEELKRAEELKEKELYRKTTEPLERNSDGTLETDSDLEIYAKKAVNALSSGVDWLLEKSEGLVDVGQGKWMDHANIDGIINGKRYNLSNKDFIGVREKRFSDITTEILAAPENQNADKVFYALRKFDGLNDDGSKRYIYKYGTANVAVADRYRDQHVKDGFEVLLEKRMLGAEKLENQLHASQEALNSRVLDYGMVKGPDGKWTTTDKASGVNFGSGYTELYYKDFLNLDNQTQEELDKNKKLSELRSEFYHKQDVKGSNLIDAFQSGATTMLAGIGDAILDAAWIGDNTWLNKYKDQKWADKFFGYDRRESTQGQNEALYDIKNGNYVDALSRVKDYGMDVFIESLPYMATMPFGVGQAAGMARVASIYRAINKAKKLGKSAEHIAKLTRRASKIVGKDAMEKYKSFENAPHIFNQLRAVSKNYGVLAINASQTNNAIDERIKAKAAAGEEPDVTAAEALGLFAFNLPFTLLDKIAFEHTVVGKGAIKAMKKGLDLVPDAGKLAIGKKVIDTGAKLMAGGAEEAGQEYLQTWGELLSAKMGVGGKTILDVLKDPESQYEAELASVAGFGAGIAPSTVGATVGPMLTKSRDALNKKVQEKALTKAIESQEPAAGFLGNDKVIELHQSSDFTGEFHRHLDEIMPVAQPNEDGSYNREDVVEELGTIYNEAIVPLRERISQLIADGADASKIKFGTSYALIERTRNAINKAKKANNLTEEDLKTIASAEQELQAFENEVGSAFEQKVKGMSWDELRAMDTDQAVKEFGSHGTSGTESSVSDDFEFPDFDNLVEDGEASVPTAEEIDNDEKLAYAHGKAGNKAKAQKYKKKARKKKIKKLTIEEIKNKDLYGKDSGIVYSAIELQRQREKLPELDQEIEKEKTATKQWMFDHGYRGKDGTIQSADEITDDDVHWFLSKENDINSDTSFNKREYYNQIKQDGRTSYADLVRKKQKHFDDVVKLYDKINHKKQFKQDKISAYKEILSKYVNDISEEYRKLTTVGLPSKETSIDDIFADPSKQNDDGSQPGSSVKNKPLTREEAIKFLRNKYGSTTAETGWARGKFKINMADVIDMMFDSSEKKQRRGAAKLIESMESEISTLDNIDINPETGEINLLDEHFKSLADYEFELERKEAEKRKGAQVEYDDIEDAKEHIDDVAEAEINQIEQEYAEKQAQIEADAQAEFESDALTEEDIAEIEARINEEKAQIEAEKQAEIEKIEQERQAKIAEQDRIAEERFRQTLDDNINIEKTREEIKELEKEIKQTYDEIDNLNIENIDGVTDLQASLLSKFKLMTQKMTAKVKSLLLRIFQLKNKIAKELGKKHKLIKELGSIKIKLEMIKDRIEYLSHNILMAETTILDSNGAHINVFAYAKKNNINVNDLINKIADGKLFEELQDTFGDIQKAAEQIIDLQEQYNEYKNQRTSIQNRLKNVNTKIKSFISEKRKIENKLNNERYQVEEATDLLYEEERLSQEEKKKLYDKINNLREKMEMLKDKIRIPYNTRSLLEAQSDLVDRAIEDGDLETDHVINRDESNPANKDINAIEGAPYKISSFATISGFAQSILSLVPVRKIKNDLLQKQVKDGVNFILNSGFIDIVHEKIKYGILAEAPFLSLLINKDGKLDENVAASIVIAAKQVLRDNGNTLYMKTKSEVARMLGIEEYEVTDEIHKAFMHKTSRSMLANEIGKNILNLLDIKQKKDGDEESFARLKATAGLVGLKYLIDEGILEEESMTMDEYSELLEKTFTQGNVSGSAKVNFVTTRKVNGRPQKLTEKEIETNKNEVEVLEESLGLPEREKTYHNKPLRKTTARKRGIRRNNYFDPSEELHRALTESEQQRYMGFVKTLKLLFSGDAILTNDEILRLIGWRPDEEIEEDDGIPLQYDKAAKIAANIEKEAAVRELRTLYEKIMLDDDFENTLYFQFFTAPNNRLYLDSSTINPQTEKELHRWLVVPQKFLVKYDVSKINDNDEKYIGFKVGIAQAFGFDIDKMELTDTISFADELLAKSEKELVEMIKNKDFDHLGHAIQGFNAIREYQNAVKNNRNEFTTVISTEYDGVTNGVILKTLQMFIGNNAATLVSKGGIVAKGVSNKAKSGTRGDKYHGGIEYETFESMSDELGKSAKDRDNGSVLDVYLTQALSTILSPAAIMSRIISKIKSSGDTEEEIAKKLKKKDQFGIFEKGADSPIFNFIPDSTEINKEIRDLFKNPTMTVNYGSALTTVIRNVTTQTIYSSITNAIIAYNFNENSEEAKKMSPEEIEAAKKKANAAGEFLYGIAQKVYGKTPPGREFTIIIQLIDEMKVNDLDKIGKEITFSDGTKRFYSIIDNIFPVFEPAIGDAVAEAIEKTFGAQIAVTEEINNASRHSFRIFAQALNYTIKKYIDEQKKAGIKNVTISPEKMKDFVEENKRFLPVFMGPGSVDRMIDGIAIFTSSVLNDGELQYSKRPKIRWSVVDESGNRKTKSMNSRIFVKKISEAHAAAGVIPTHTEDAIDMSRFINFAMEQYGVTHVHDAIVLSGYNNGTQLRFMNKTIIQTSKSYDLLNSIYDAMESVYVEAQKYNESHEEKLELDDLSTKAEKRKAGPDHVPAKFLNDIMDLLNSSETIWENRQEFFAHDIKADQMPGPKSMYEEKAKYDRKKFVREAMKRVRSRNIFLNEYGEDKISTNISWFIEILDHVTGKENNETDKILKALDAIRLFTTVISGDFNSNISDVDSQNILEGC